MSAPYFQELFADRIGGSSYGTGTEIYKFEKIKRAKRKALADHPDRQLLDFGIGENDAMAPENVRQRMTEEIDKPENRGYADNGIWEFKQAAARSCSATSMSNVDATTEVNHCIGSKTALAMLPACFINPGDITLMTVPGYPVAGTHTRYYGGAVYNLPLLAENRFLARSEVDPGRCPGKGEVAGPELPEQPDRESRHARVLRTGDRVRRRTQDRCGPGCRPHSADVRRPAAQLLIDPGGKRCRGRSPFVVERVRHDRLAHGLGVRQCQNRPGVLGCEGQL